jgi:hypothetical protein
LTQVSRARLLNLREQSFHGAGPTGVEGHKQPTRLWFPCSDHSRLPNDTSKGWKKSDAGSSSR